MKKKVVIPIAGLIVVGAIAGYLMFGRNREIGTKYRKDALARGDIEAVVVTSGTINPVTIVDVGSQVSGKIAKLNADFNSKVREGQVVAELEQSLFITKVEQNEANYQSSLASLERAQVSLEMAKRKYERALSLFEKNQISFEEKENSEAQYLGAKTDLKSAEARLQQAKSQLDSSKVDMAYTVIRSPVDGMVISRNVNVGQTVAASYQAPVLFKIANDLTKMQVECDIDEADIGKIKEGQKVRFTVDAFPQDAFNGTVTQVRFAPEVVQNVVTYATIVDVGNPEMKLRPGMTATVSIITGEAKNVLRVPNSALRFNPPLSPEEIEGIMKSVREKMTAQRQQQGGSQREGGSEGQRPQGGSPERGAQMFGGQMPGGFGQGMRSPDGKPRAGGRQQMARVWIEDEKGALLPVFVRTGVTDNTYTEVVWGDLKEGQMVLTGVETAPGAQSSQQSPNPMGGGPRFFIPR